MPPSLRPPVEIHLARRRAVGALAALGGLAAFDARAQFRVQISGIGGTQIPVAVAALRDEETTGVPMGAIIRADLLRSGAFRLIDPPTAVDERSRAPVEDWRARGADALAVGSVSRLADGRLDVRLRLWDVVKGTELLGQGRAVQPAELRLEAHRIADAIHAKLTGEPGAFATRLAYVSKRANRFSLHVTDADGEGGQVALTSPEPIISPAWSPSGRELAYVSFESQKAVVWVQDLGSGQRRMVANYRGSNSAPAWSPDGRELAVALSRDGSTQIHVVPREGGNPRRLTTSSAIDTEPVYAPDGQSICFVSDRGGSPQIYRMPVAGGNAERISFAGNYNISPALSPDGKMLAFITRQGSAFKLMTQDLASGAVTQLTDTADDQSPSWAPNGRLLVYATRLQGRDMLVCCTPDGKIKTPLVASGSDLREPAWGPFGR